MTHLGYVIDVIGSRRLRPHYGSRFCKSAAGTRDPRLKAWATSSSADGDGALIHDL
jgi:hypothetical protein